MTRDRVTDYARRVAAGEVKGVGVLHILACKRHLHDLERQGKPGFEYRWDPKASDRFLQYAETLTIGEGFEKKGLRLLDSQAFDLGSLFGWVNAQGYRRFRRSYTSMARQNGKTMRNGILGTYLAAFSGYRYGKLCTVATQQSQARLAWEEMKHFIESDPDLLYDKVDNPDGYFRVFDYKSEIVALNTECTITALSPQRSMLDGVRNIYCSVDEIHQHKDNKIYKALYNGTRALPEALVSMITTRGDDLNSFCKEMDDYAIRILRLQSTAEDFFVDIYALDEGDDPWLEENWSKANPYLMTDPEKVKTLRRDAQTAQDMGGAEMRDFMIKSLNMWVQNEDRMYIDSEKWDACGSDMTLEDMRGRKCYVGLDLSSGGDLTTWSLEFPLDDGTYYIYSHSYMPRARLAEHVRTDLAPYDLWASEGLITVTGGDDDFKNDYGFIIKELGEIRKEYGVEFAAIGVDPHNFDGFREQLEELGAPVVIIKPSAKSLNDPTVDLRLLVKSGKVRYDRRNELLTWSFLNAAVVSNSMGEIKVDKRDGFRNKRIDPVDAAIDAHAVMLKAQLEEKADVEAGLASYLELMGWS